MVYACKCGKTFESAQSRNAHYSHCLIHRNGKPETRKFVIEKKMAGWDAFSKEAITDIHRRSASHKRRPMSDETKRKLSLSLTGKTGGYREGTNKWKGGKVFSSYENREIWLDSKWEIRFVTLLDKYQIKWRKNYEGFEYQWNGISKKYVPDFYLEKYDLWIEVKGWERPIDIEKWKAFPYSLTVIKKSKLEKLEKSTNFESFISGLLE